MKKKIFIIIALFMLFSTESIAQKLSSSPFSKYGVGELFFQGNGRQITMGNTGIADNSPFHISNLNPACLSTIKPNNIIFEVSLFHKISNYNTPNETQSNQISNFKHIMTGFRITNWWQTSLGILPYSGMGYRLISNDSLEKDNFKINYVNDYEGKGGINQFFWSNSFRLLNNFSVGVTASYNFGSIDKVNTTSIIENGYYSKVVSDERDIIKKISFNFGFLYADSIRKDEYSNILTYSVGATYSNKYTINPTQTKSISRTLSMYNKTFYDSIFYDTVGTSSITIPASLGVGVAFCLYDKLSINIDYKMQNWSDVSILGKSKFANSQFVGFGAEYVIAKASKKFYQTIRYRAGAYYNSSYIQHNSKEVKTQAFTVGIGIPIKSIQLNLGYVIGKTGSLDVGLSEKFQEFNLSISLYDIWFIKRKFM